MDITTEIKKYADSAELYTKVESIGTDFGLHIDQVGELDAEISDILYGVSDKNEFVSHIMERLEVDRTMAERISSAVNEQIFKSLRTQLQSQTNVETEHTISSIERAGGFEIDRHPAGNGNGNGEENAGNGNGGSGNGHYGIVSSADRVNLLEEVENPKPAPEHMETKAPVPTAASVAETKSAPIPTPKVPGVAPKTEPLVDQLLKGPAAIPEVKVQRKSINLFDKPENKPVAEPPKNLPTKDPYREAVE